MRFSSDISRNAGVGSLNFESFPGFQAPTVCALGYRSDRGHPWWPSYWLRSSPAMLSTLWVAWHWSQMLGLSSAAEACSSIRMSGGT